MEKILREYKRLKAQLSGELGSEGCEFEASWNDGIMEEMETLIDGFPTDIKNAIRLNHI